VDATLAATIAEANVLRYAGYCFDEHSGLYYLSQRYYDPATCQFITKDPAKADGEESAYQYCGGDPVGKVDPSGEVAQYVWSGCRRGKLTVFHASTWRIAWVAATAYASMYIGTPLSDDLGELYLYRLYVSASVGFARTAQKTYVRVDTARGLAPDVWGAHRPRLKITATTYRRRYKGIVSTSSTTIYNVLGSKRNGANLRVKGNTEVNFVTIKRELRYGSGRKLYTNLGREYMTFSRPMDARRVRGNLAC